MGSKNRPSNRKLSFKCNITFIFQDKPYPGSTETPPVAGCDGNGPLIIANQSYGYLESLGYPGLYSNELFCEWIIRVEEGNRIRVTFLDFDLEDGYELNNNYQNCTFNYKNTEVYLEIL